MPRASAGHVIVVGVGARHMLAVPTIRRGCHVGGALRYRGFDGRRTAACTRRLDRRGCDEQRHQEGGNGKNTTHRTQGQDI